MTIYIYILLGLLAGACFPIQATINSKLRSYTKSALTASLIAFSVGSIVLAFCLLIIDRQFYKIIDFSFPVSTFVGGAISGLIFNVTNIILFAKIGATITTLATITGQIIMGLILDHFGILDLSIQPISALRIIGVILMIVAIFLYQRANNPLADSTNPTKQGQYIKYWLLLGVFVGIFPPLQAAFNGQLRLATESILTATFISFFIGAILLACLVLMTEKRIKIPLHDDQRQRIPLWVFSGGLFGIMIVGGIIVVIHSLGAVLTTLIFIFGQILMAITIDHFGLFGIKKRKITRQKLISIGLMSLALILV